MNNLKQVLLIVFSVFCLTAFSQSKSSILVDVDKPKCKIQPTMWGVFFEDINFAADGGLYAELIKNRSFEFFKPLTGWIVEKASKDSSHLIIVNRGKDEENNPRFARVKVNNNSGTLSLTNKGFRGMGIKKDNSYRFSVLASAKEGNNIKLKIELFASDGTQLGNTLLAIQGSEWKNYETVFKATNTDEKASLKISFIGDGILEMDMVSLFPLDTWENRKNGMRADLVQLLADLKPGFFRFPGGCIVEGRELDTRYQWKKTVGNIEDRKMIVNRWNTEFNHRPTPDYFQSFGLGFFEYFQLAEDLDAEPLPILNCGMACQFNTAEIVPLDQLEPYVQDALDLIEFANGTIDSKWGGLRAEMGHAAPFNLKYLGVGNEQWGPQFFERYAIFEKAIREKYPDILLISSTGPFPDGSLFDFAVGELEKYNADIVDEHYYRNPEWFFENADRYDSYDREKYEIFAGEYAAQSVSIASPDNKNNWECALSEAAYMTGLERNADVVTMCAYAPLFAHVDGWQWTPDLIWFNNLKSFGTANYYVQKLFSTNKGTDVLTIEKDEKPLIGNEGIYASAVWDEYNNEVILKLVNSNNTQKSADIVLKTKKKFESEAKVQLLANSDLKAFNTIDRPDIVKPIDKVIISKGKNVKIDLEPYSLTIIRLKQR